MLTNLMYKYRGAEVMALETELLTNAFTYTNPIKVLGARAISAYFIADKGAGSNGTFYVATKGIGIDFGNAVMQEGTPPAAYYLTGSGSGAEALLGLTLAAITPSSPATRTMMSAGFMVSAAALFTPAHFITLGLRSVTESIFFKDAFVYVWG